MLQLSVFLQDFGVCLWGIFAHSSRRAFVRSDTVVGGDDLAHCLSSSSSLRCSVGLRSGLCAGLTFMDFGPSRNRKGPSPNCAYKVV